MPGVENAYEYPGATERCLAGARTSLGSTYYAAVADLTNDKPAPRILDVGCGGGALLEALAVAHPSAALTGIDRSWDEVRHAHRRADGQRRWSVLQGDWSQVPIRPASVDLAVSSLAVMSAVDLDAVLRGMRSTLRAGGRVVLVVPGFGASSPYDDLMKLIEDRVQGQGAAPELADWDRARSCIEAALQPTIPLERVDFDVYFEGSPAAIAATLAAFTYATYALLPADRARLVDELAVCMTERSIDRLAVPHSAVIARLA